MFLRIVAQKLFFGNSYHTVQILKSFIIYALYGVQQILLNFVFMHNAVHKFQFSYSWALRNYRQKLPVFMRIS